MGAGEGVLVVVGGAVDFGTSINKAALAIVEINT